MKTIRAIFRHSGFKPLDPVDLRENTRLSVLLLDGDEVEADGITELAGRDQAFEFLNDAREDVHSESDGEAV